MDSTVYMLSILDQARCMLAAVAAMGITGGLLALLTGGYIGSAIWDSSHNMEKAAKIWKASRVDCVELRRLCCWHNAMRISWKNNGENL